MIAALSRLITYCSTAGRYRIAQGIVLVLFLLVGITLLWCVYTIITLPSPNIQALIQYNKTLSQKSTTNQSSVAIAQWHLFGDHGTQASSSSAQPLSLQGIVIPSDPKKAVVIITLNGTDKTYAIGSNLPNGTILRAIYADHIVVSKQGQTEKVFLLWVKNTQGLIKNPPPFRPNQFRPLSTPQMKEAKP
jgi:type II secretion system protein C